MENNSKRQSSDKSPSPHPRNPTSSLSALAEPFTLKRSSVLQSKAHPFIPPSSCLELDGESLGDYTTQNLNYLVYTSEGLGECLDPSYYGAIAHGSEFSGSNRSRNSAGPLYFGPSDGAGKKEKNTSALTANQSSEREGNNACQESKSPDGSHGSVSRKSTVSSKEEAQDRSQPKGQIAAENPSLMKSSHQINSATVSRSTHMSSGSLISNFSLNVKAKDSEGSAAVEGPSVLVDKNDLDSKEPDEDSPCWRGRMNLPKSPFAPSQCSNTKFPENRSEACWTLNPMAPQYIPQSAQTRLNAKESRCSYSDEIQELDKEHCLRDKTGSLSPLGPEAVPPFAEEEHITPGRNMVAGMILQVPRNDVEDVSANEALLHISEYISMCTSSDAELVINIMLDFSEFLFKKFSDNQFLSEPLRKKIQVIMQNLSACKGERGVRGSCSPPNISSVDTLKPRFKNTPDFMGSSEKPDLYYQITNVEIHPDGGKAVIAAPELDSISNCRPRKPDPPPLTKKVWDSCNFIGNIGAEIAQADRNSSTVGLEMDQQMSPQTLLYKTLWLQATEELHSLKSRSLRSVKSGAGRSSSREP